ncbi:MAG TPA: ABC transporter permease [Candidatus Nanopelagicaceae bacterium]|nr:ABC transporter permease [Candidatus Nanopelagicaceae bacterium]
MSSSFDVGGPSALEIEEIGRIVIEKRTALLKKEKMTRIGYRLLSFVIIAAAWQYYGSRTMEILFSPLTKVFKDMFSMFAHDQLASALMVSVETFLIGLSVGTAIGITLGMLMGVFRNFDALVGIYIFALYATPMVTLVPLLTIWFGFGKMAQSLITILFVIFPVSINVYNGVRNVDKSLLEVGQSFCANRRQIWGHIVLPGSVPFIVTGVSQGVAMGLVGMFIAEISTALSGLGAVLTAQSNAYHTSKVLGIILIIMVLGVVFRTLMRLVERKVAPWFGQP